MKDRSGSSIMDPKTQVTRSTASRSSTPPSTRWNPTIAWPLIREHNDANDNALFNTAVAAEVNLHGDAMRWPLPKHRAKPAMRPTP